MSLMRVRIPVSSIAIAPTLCQAKGAQWYLPATEQSPPVVGARGPGALRAEMYASVEFLPVFHHELRRLETLVEVDVETIREARPRQSARPLASRIERYRVDVAVGADRPQHELEVAFAHHARVAARRIRRRSRVPGIPAPRARRPGADARARGSGLPDRSLRRSSSRRATRNRRRGVAPRRRRRVKRHRGRRARDSSPPPSHVPRSG